MKNIKRVLSFFLTLALLLTMLPGAAAVELSNFKQVNSYQAGQFSDVSSGVWFESGVKSAYELDLMTGVSDRAFAPDGKITLAQAVVMAARLHCIYNGLAQDFQQDGGAWYSSYVDFAKSVGILTQDYADYNQPATRAEFASLLARALPASALESINKIPEGGIPDVNDTHPGAKEIYLLYRAGVLSGSTYSMTFRPEDSIQRAEAASIVTRMALPDQRVKKTDEMVSVVTDPSDNIDIVMLAFWGTGITDGQPPDVVDRMAAHLGVVDRIYKEYKGNERIEIVSFPCGDSTEALRKFVDQYGDQYQYSIPTLEGGPKILESWGIDALPCIIFMDGNGQAIAPILKGVATYEDLKIIVEALLRR